MSTSSRHPEAETSMRKEECNHGRSYEKRISTERPDVERISAKDLSTERFDAKGTSAERSNAKGTGGAGHERTETEVR